MGVGVTHVGVAGETRGRVMGSVLGEGERAEEDLRF